jgi:DnaK suppressor protein
MKKQQLRYLEGLLQGKIDQLLGKADQTVGRMTRSATQFADPNDRATLETDRNFVLRVRDRERKLIQKAQEALTRIKSGTYGYCKMCHEPISASRLEARPEAELCIECKTEMESRERRPRYLG